MDPLINVKTSAGKSIVLNFGTMSAVVESHGVFETLGYTGTCFTHTAGDRVRVLKLRKGDQDIKVAISHHQCEEVDNRENIYNTHILEIAVPGVSEMIRLHDEWALYNDRSACVQEDVFYDGSGPPKCPSIDLDKARRQNPRAALYIDALSYSESSNYHKRSAGFKAVLLLKSGGSATAARMIMNNWLHPERCAGIEL